MRYIGYGMGYGFGPIEFIFHALLWILVIVVIVKMVMGRGWHERYRHDWLEEGYGGHGNHGGNDALDILKKRYARGEIDKNEFEEKKADLKKE